MKKIFSLFMALVVLLSVTVYAAPEYSDNVADMLSELSVMQGDTNGNMRYDDYVSRAECTKVVVALSTYRDSVAKSSKISPFKDVPYTHWASPYVAVAVKNGICKGFLDATFRPSNTVLYEEAIAMFLRVLGYSDEDFGGSWPDGQVGIAKNIGVVDNINKSIGDALTRRDIATMAYNTLNTKSKGSQSVLLSTFNRSIIDDVVLVSTIDEDPSIADGKVFTSAGTYNISDKFDHSNIGKKGSMVLRNGDTVVSFIPNGLSSGNDKQMVYSALGDGIVTYKNGSFNQINVNADTVFYMDSNKITSANAISSLEMGDILNVSYNSNGKIDYITCVSGSTIGPKTVKSPQWYESFGADSSITVMRDGVKSSINDVKTNDIAYYLKELNIALVYSKKITGIYEDATPNKDAPTSVTISGVTYQLESVDSFSKLSSNGTFNFGDTVTLLLGKSGKVADVATDSQLNHKIYGFLTYCGTKQTTVSGSVVTRPYIKIALPSGEIYEYITNKDYSSFLNSPVLVNLNSGIATLTKNIPNSELSGKFSWDTNGGKIGTTPVSKDVQIIEVSSTEPTETAVTAKVFPQRLNGISISKNHTLFASKNSDGQIDKLILKDITGDMHTYGILTKATTTEHGMSVSGSYEYISNGTIASFSTMNTAFNISAGHPIKITSDGKNITSIIALNKTDGSKITDISGSAITIGGKSYTMSDNVDIYIKESYTNNYTMITLEELEEKAKSHQASVYMDSTISASGRVRIIILS